jgi:hypothetical protein
MVARGHVHNGVVVLDDDVRFPEGQEVTVFAGAATPAQPALRDSSPHSVLDIRCISLGAVRHVQNTDDDLLGEMLEGRP